VYSFREDSADNEDHLTLPYRTTVNTPPTRAAARADTLMIPPSDLAHVDTPALLLDTDALHANIDHMARYFAGKPATLRPHFKSHKCTALARLQLQAGNAVGITCAKLGEAEVAADAGIRNILIANQIVGPLKISRLVALAKRADVMVAVDSVDNVTMISEMASATGARVGVLVEVDIGMHRCGVGSPDQALALSRVVAAAPGLRFEGLQGYEGHCIDLRDDAERMRQARAALETLVDARRFIERAGVRVNVVSGGGTGTYMLWAETDGVDEVQVGSYATMDWFYQDIRPEFKQAMSVLATVISRTNPEQIVIDVGCKGIGAEWGPPRVRHVPGAEVTSCSSEEHMKIRVPAGCALAVGDRIELVPSHGCTTSNLYPEFVLHRGGRVTGSWPIDGRGKLQ
jgi:D-serine deaminase-like pyridoxal phosphate-dependent protein